MTWSVCSEILSAESEARDDHDILIPNKVVDKEEKRKSYLHPRKDVADQLA